MTTFEYEEFSEGMETFFEVGHSIFNVRESAIRLEVVYDEHNEGVSLNLSPEEAEELVEKIQAAVKKWRAKWQST
jgi:hypothetical protein